MTVKQIKMALAKMLQSLSEITTNNGVLTYDGEFIIGTFVYVLDDNGEYTPAPDGLYNTETQTITVKDGAIVDIQVIEEPVVEEVAVKANIVEDIIELEQFYKVIEQISNRLIALEDTVKQLSEKVEKMGQMSVAMSAQEVIDNQTSIKTGDISIDKKLKNFGIN